MSGLGDGEYLDIYGVSPHVIGFLMTIVTLLSPHASYHVEFAFFGLYISPGLYAPIWTLPYGMGLRVHVLYPLLSAPYLLMAMPSFLFLVWIVRYYQGKTSRSSAIVVGSFTVLLPLVVAVFFTNPDLITYYSGPVPIQFLFGLLLLYRIEGPELRTPWEGQPMSSSWWERPKHRYPSHQHSTTGVVSDEEREDGDWLE